MSLEVRNGIKHDCLISLIHYMDKIIQSNRFVVAKELLIGRSSYEKCQRHLDSVCFKYERNVKTERQLNKYVSSPSWSFLISPTINVIVIGSMDGKYVQNLMI